MATQVPVTGQFQSSPGVASTAAHLQWQLSSPMFDTAGRIVASTAAIPVTLDGTGRFSTVLVANDDPTTNPAGTTWRLSGWVDGEWFSQTYVISHTMAPSIDLSLLTPAAATNPLFPVNAVQLQGRGVSAATPTDGQLLKWVATDSLWEPATPPSGRMYASSQTVFSSGSIIQVTGMVQDFVSGGVTFAANALTVPITGKYVVSAQIWWQSGVAVTGLVAALAYRNGANVRQWSEQVSGVTVSSSGGSDLVSLTAGDVLALYGYQGTGSSQNSETGTQYTFLSCVWVSP